MRPAVITRGKGASVIVERFSDGSARVTEIVFALA
jgi:hypothetical protein